MNHTTPTLNTFICTYSGRMGVIKTESPEKAQEKAAAAWNTKPDNIRVKPA